MLTVPPCIVPTLPTSPLSAHTRPCSLTPCFYTRPAPPPFPLCRCPWRSVGTTRTGARLPTWTHTSSPASLWRPPCSTTERPAPPRPDASLVGATLVCGAGHCCILDTRPGIPGAKESVSVSSCGVRPPPCLPAYLPGRLGAAGGLAWIQDPCLAREIRGRLMVAHDQRVRVHV